MAKGTEAYINSELLIWARESASFSQEEITVKLKLKENVLSAWEKGEERPSIPQLRRLAAIYRRPIAVFYLPERPLDFAPIRDFRRIPDIIGFKQKSELSFAIRDAYIKRETLIELWELLEEEIPIPRIDINMKDDFEDTAKKIRSVLNISFETQISWRDEYEALDNWRAAVEKQGLLVIQISGIDVSELRGFALNEIPLPVIGLNTKDLPRARIFSLIHEFVHILLNQSSICDIHDEYSRGESEQKIEVFCNNVAGAVLFPMEKTSYISDISNISKVTSNQLSSFANKLKISRECILRRFLIAELVSETHYKKLRKEFVEEYERMEKKKGGFALPHTKALNNCGLTFTSIVLNNFYQDRISLNDVSSYMQLKTKHIERLEKDFGIKALKVGFSL